MQQIETDEIRPIEVVRAVSVANRWNAQHVGAVVTHLCNEPGRLLALLEGMSEYDGTSMEPVSAFAAGAFDGGIGALTTRGGRLSEDDLQCVYKSLKPLRRRKREKCIQALEVMAFSQNVNFLYHGARHLEGLLVASRAHPRITKAWGVRLRDLANCIASAAVDAKLPILFLLSPAALPREESADMGGQVGNSGAAALLPDWRRPSGYALRFSVAVPRGNIGSELRFRQSIVSRASRLQCGLFVRRGERDRGGPGWEKLLSLPQHANVAPELGERDPKKSLSLTAVGPARVGSSSTWFVAAERKASALVRSL